MLPNDFLDSQMFLATVPCAPLLASQYPVPEHKKKSNEGAIVGGIMGGLIGACLLIGLVVYIRSRKRRSYATIGQF